VIATGFENNKTYRSERTNRVSSNPLSPQIAEENGARIPEFLRRRQQETENQS
jgi:cell division protein FtsZ